MSVSGAYLEAVIGGVSVSGLHQWEADDSGTDKLDRTSGKDQKCTNTDVGCYDLTVTLRLYFDLTDGIGLEVYTGDILYNVYLYRADGDASPAFTLPEAIVTQSPESVEVRGRCELTLTIKNRGLYEQNRY